MATSAIGEGRPAGREAAKKHPEREVASRGPFAPALDELRRAHRALLTEYVGVLAELTMLEDGQGRGWAPPWTLPWAVKRFVHSHIRRKAKELGQAYIELEQTLPDEPAHPAYADWLKATRGQLEQFHDALSSWRVPGLITLATFAVTLGAAAAKVRWHDLSRNAALFSDRFTVELFFVEIGFLVIFPLFVIHQSFRFKRDLFLGRRRTEVSEAIDGDRNVYRAEAAIFTLLRRGRTRESPADYSARVLAALGVVLMIVIAPAVFHFRPNAIWGVAFAVSDLGSIALVAWLVGSRPDRRREWR